MGYLIDSNSVSSDTPKGFRFCKDCKYVQFKSENNGATLCVNPALVVGYDLVTGLAINALAKQHRYNEKSCGREGKYYEAFVDAAYYVK